MAVKYGKHGGVSHLNKDWKSYYGEEAYNRYVSDMRRRREEYEKKAAEEKKRREQLDEALRDNPELQSIYDEMASYADIDAEAESEGYDCYDE